MWFCHPVYLIFLSGVICCSLESVLKINRPCSVLTSKGDVVLKVEVLVILTRNDTLMEALYFLPD